MFELDVYLRDRLIGRTTFNADEVRIGRGADNELQIDNLALSRYHASIENVQGLYVLKDFGSQNGTFVNGEKIVGRRALNDGDRIGFGKFVVLFRCEEAKATAGRRGARVTDEAAFAVAGETLVTKGTDTRERTCPHVGYLSSELRPGARAAVYPVGRDIFVVGSQHGSDVTIETGPARAAAIVRGWRGFSLVALASGQRRNGEQVDLRAELVDGDLLELGGSRFTFHAGKPEAGP